MNAFAPIGSTSMRSWRRWLDRHAAVFRLTRREILSRSRQQRTAAARQVALAILRFDRSGLAWGGGTLPQIGRLFDLDHTTVLHACRKYEGWCAALGIDPACGDPIDRARTIARHLGYGPPDPAHVDAWIAAEAVEALAPAAAPAPPPLPPPPVPVVAPPPELPMPPPSLPMPVIINGDLFGAVDAASFAALPLEMRQEAILLFCERLRTEDPRLSEAAVETKAAIAFAMRRDELQAELSARLPPHVPAWMREGSEGAPPEPARAAPDAVRPDGNFIAFAQIHLTADTGGGFTVAEAHAAFTAFCRRRHETPMPRTNFAVELRRLGGHRVADRIEGLRLRPAMAEAAE